jgi:hypothetical protein
VGTVLSLEQRQRRLYKMDPAMKNSLWYLFIAYSFITTTFLFLYFAVEE